MKEIHDDVGLLKDHKSFLVQSSKRTGNPFWGSKTQHCEEGWDLERISSSYIDDIIFEVFELC